MIKAGGFALSRDKPSDKAKLNDNSLKSAADTGFKITTSQQL